MKGAQNNAIACLSDGHIAWGRELPPELNNPLGGTAYVQPHVPRSRKNTMEGGGMLSMLSFTKSTKGANNVLVEVSPGTLTEHTESSHSGSAQLLNNQL